MADVIVSQACLLSLPLELLDETCDFLERRELKATRQSCKYLCKLSTPRLFADFTLYPHTLSFERLTNIAHSPSLRHVVKRLEYDTRYLGVTNRIVERIQSVWSCDIDQAEKKRLVEIARTIDSQKIRARSTMDNLIQSSHLEHCLPLLTDLKALVVRDYGARSTYTFYREDIPSFYEELIQSTCGKSPHTRLERGLLGFTHTDLETYAYAVLVAARRLSAPLETLKLTGVNWYSFLERDDLSKYSSIFSQMLAPVKCLELGTDIIDQFPSTQAMRNLQMLLKASINVEELTLQIRQVDDIVIHGPDLIDPGEDEPMHSMFRPFRGERMPHTLSARLIWSSKLRKLSLVGAHCTSKEMREVLKHCASTLESLELSGIVLMPEQHSLISETRKAPRACLVSLFKWMRRHLSLKSVKFFGCLTNGGMQHWLISPCERDRGREILYNKVQDWFMNGGPCPLEHVAIKPGEYDVQKKAFKNSVPAVLMEDLEYFGDRTWSMEYDGDDSDDSDDDLEDDGFDSTDDFEYDDLDEDLDEDGFGPLELLGHITALMPPLGTDPDFL